jgi:ATPase family associated with various cellular activities (AAA)
MNQHVRQMDLSGLAFAAISACLPDAPPEPLAGGVVAAAAVARLAPAGHDCAMARLADALSLTTPELLAMAALAAVELDPEACRSIAQCQAPVGGARPLAGLLATAFAAFGSAESVMLDLCAGRALRSGCFRLGPEDAPLAERSLALALPVLQALRGARSALPGVALEEPGKNLPLPAAIAAEAEVWASVLAPGKSQGLIIRAMDIADARAAAAAIAAKLARAAAFVEGDLPEGFAPWLFAASAIPVFITNPGIGERRAIPPLPYYDGPWLCIAGRDGAITGAATTATWQLDMPTASERAALWAAAGLSEDAANRAAATFTLGPAAIALAAAAARRGGQLRGSPAPDWPDVATALATESHAALDGLAERVRGTINDDGLVAPPALARPLDHLLNHCRLRDGLAVDLGPAAANRSSSGVRALFHGPSGTGKSLAAHWLASRLAMALYRVDLGAIMSKWIGDTEKNLGQLLAAAEYANVILLFDEADALFGARTDMNSANDKFANGQTNYLLQKLESWNGIVFLTSNARDRMDSAFTRRLDSIIEFPLPDAHARLKLWQAHLGKAHSLAEADLHRLAASADLAGGHIRNIVLGAAVAARTGSQSIAMDHLIAAAQSEYAKLGRSPPRELA